MNETLIKVTSFAVTEEFMLRFVALIVSFSVSVCVLYI